MAEKKHHAEITTPFGPGMTTFRLGYREYATWEAERQKSLMGTLTAMVASSSCEMEDVRALIRLALVGAGMGHTDAILFLARYVDNYPLDRSYAVALSIADAAVFGSEEWRAAEKARVETQEA